MKEKKKEGRITCLQRSFWRQLNFGQKIANNERCSAFPQEAIGTLCPLDTWTCSQCDWLRDRLIIYVNNKEQSTLQFSLLFYSPVKDRCVVSNYSLIGIGRNINIIGTFVLINGEKLPHATQHEK